MKKYALNLINFVNDKTTGIVEPKFLWAVIVADNKKEATKFSENILKEDFKDKEKPIYKLNIIK